MMNDFGGCWITTLSTTPTILTYYRGSKLEREYGFTTCYR